MTTPPYHHFSREIPCPACANPCSAASSFDFQILVPEPGDIAICFYCGEILEFTAELSLQKMPAEAIAAMSERERVQLYGQRDALMRFRRAQERTINPN